MNQQNCSKSSGRLQREKDQNSPESVCRETRFTGAENRHDRVHKVHRPLKLPHVQHINSTGQNVQQIFEVSQQHCMNFDVPAEMQCREIRCQNTATRQNIVKDAQMQRQVQMIHKMPSDFHSKVQNMLMPGSSEAAVQSPGPALQISSRRQTSLRSTRHEDLQAEVNRL